MRKGLFMIIMKVAIVFKSYQSYISLHVIATDFNIPITVILSSLTSTSVTISWTQPPFSLPMDEYRVELRRVTDARQFCQEVRDFKSKVATRSASTLSVDFSNLHEFSIYQVTILVTTTSGYNATLRPTVEFTTKAIGMTIIRIYTLNYTYNRDENLLCCSTYCSPTHKHFLFHLQKC